MRGPGGAPLVVRGARPQSEMSATSLAATFDALADPTGRGVVELLRTRPHRASDLAHKLGQSRPAMSRHLKVLRQGGLVEPANDDADMRARVYRLRQEPFEELRDWVEE